MKTLIIGSNGQDGFYLRMQIEEKGTVVYCLNRQGLFQGLRQIGGPVDLTNASEVKRLVAKVLPDQVYYLAAHHHSSEESLSDQHHEMTMGLATNTIGISNMLESIVAEKMATRVFYASSSRIFGRPDESPQNENTRLQPNCAYGISKSAGMQVCQYFRTEKGVFCSTGILYNHESPRRSPNFFTRKVVQAAVEIANDRRDGLILADIAALVDWGYAPEYTKAMQLVLGADEPDDFIIASGKSGTTGEFLAAVFENLDINWKDYVSLDPTVTNNSQTGLAMVGAPEMIYDVTGWRATVGVEELAKIMIDAELKLQMGKTG